MVFFDWMNYEKYTKLFYNFILMSVRYLTTATKITLYKIKAYILIHKSHSACRKLCIIIVVLFCNWKVNLGRTLQSLGQAEC